MTRIGAIFILLCLSMLLASCSRGSNIGIDPDSRATGVEQAHQEADAHLALAAMVLDEALAAAEAAQTCLVELEAATAHVHAAMAATEFGTAVQRLSFAEGYWPWPEEAWLATQLGIPLEEAEEGLTALSEVMKKTAKQAQRAEDTARYSAEVAMESVETIQALAETFQTNELRAALGLAAVASEKAREVVANTELMIIRVAESAAYAARLPAELESLAYTGKAGRHYARVRTIGGRIHALAMGTDPDEFPYAHAISSLEGFANLPTWGLPDLGGGWTTRVLKTPSSERAVVYSHPDHLHFGWWFTAPHDPEDLRFDTFMRGDNLLPSGHVKALTGTATYEGPAAGIYVKRSAGTGYAAKGVFAATVTLTADFGDAGTIGGAVRDFTEDGSPIGAWTVNLMPASLATEANAFKGAIGGAAANRAWDDGNWTGGFFDQALDGSPVAVLGEFHAVAGTPQAKDGDTGFSGLSGAFGAHAGE